MHDDAAGIGADDARHFVADGDRHVPPAFGPRAHAARGPGLGVFVQTRVGRPRHRPQAVGDQIDSLFENRKLAAPFEQIVSQSTLR